MDGGWQPIGATAKAAGEVQVHRLGKYAWQEPQAATWRDDPDGMSGWFNRAGEYLTPVPTHWKPLQGGVH
jgi:hypothetical protein